VVISPVEQFNQALTAQVPLEQIAPEERAVFPSPLGAWLARGRPLHFRNNLRRSGATPAGLLHYWLVKCPPWLQIEKWTKKQVEERFESWPEPIRAVYNRDRTAFVELITVKGKVSARSRLVCGRYGAWRAMAALEVGSMPVSDFSWAGLATRVAGGVLDAGEGYSLVSDNSKKRVEGVVYTASEIIRLLEAGSDSLATVAGVKAVFDRATILSIERKTALQAGPARVPGSIHTFLREVSG